jgi:hypothetical protein
MGLRSKNLAKLLRSEKFEIEGNAKRAKERKKKMINKFVGSIANIRYQECGNASQRYSKGEQQVTTVS